MIILAIETSAQAASAALVGLDKTIAEVTFNNKKNHSETLMPMIEFMFKTAEIDLADVDYIAVTTGPGSFTGIRIGAATAKALAHGTGKKIIGVATLDALAYNVLCDDCIIVPVMDARRDQVYTCFYESGSENCGLSETGGSDVYDSAVTGSRKIRRLTDYMAVDIAECINTAKSFGKKTIFLGDALPVFGQTILDAHSNFSLAPANSNMQRASSVGLAAIQKISSAVTYDALEIFYLRKSQAEREYERNRA
jgi:tRNA threonylcarbamoyladenosine biosynthesis protein TsaB